ncbi:UNVERIFIED_CONTAM: zmynd10 [Trichonephila clavipes]
MKGIGNVDLTILILNQVTRMTPELTSTSQKPYHTNWETLSLNRFNVHQFSLHSRSSVAPGFETVPRRQLGNCGHHKILTTSFDLKNIEAMLPDIPLCAQCNSKGLKRCSRCKNEWYCGRPCQVSHWSKHQSACNLMVN